MVDRGVSILGKKLLRMMGGTVALVALTCSHLYAEPIVFYSGDGGDLVNGLPSVTLVAHSAWGDVSSYAGLLPGTAKWISFENSGLGGLIAPDVVSRDLGFQTASFTRSFELLSQSNLSLWVLADDTATVRLLGPSGYINTLFTAYRGDAYHGAQIDPCAPGGTGAGLGCLEADMGAAVATLAAGRYTLEIDAFQTHGDVFGAQYGGKIAPVPEPSSLLLLGSGMGFLALHKRFRNPARRVIGR